MHADIIQNRDSASICNIGRSRATHTKYKKVKLGGGQACDQVIKLPL